MANADMTNPPPDAPIAVIRNPPLDTPAGSGGGESVPTSSSGMVENPPLEAGMTPAAISGAIENPPLPQGEPGGATAPAVGRAVENPPLPDTTGPGRTSGVIENPPITQETQATAPEGMTTSEVPAGPPPGLRLPNPHLGVEGAAPGGDPGNPEPPRGGRRRGST